MNNDIWVGRMLLTSRVMNAAGYCKDLDLVEALANTNAGAIVLGSITKDPRPYNPGITYGFDQEHNVSINALGLPNHGSQYYAKIMHHIVNAAHARLKPLIVSIAGFSVKEYVFLAKLFAAFDIDGIEVNLGCPNTIDSSGKRHAIASYNLMLTKRIMTQVRKAVTKINPLITVGMKVSPYEPGFLRTMATMVKDYQLAEFVTVSNTHPNTLVLKADGTPLLDQMKFGGGAGPGFFSDTLGNVAQWYDILGDTIQIFASGGASSNEDVKKLLSVGG